MDMGLVVKSLLMPLERILFLLKLRGGTDFPRKPKKAESCPSREPGKNKWFFHWEVPEEQEEPEDLSGILEWEEFWILESEPVVNPIPEVPMDDYLQKELERQKEEELAEMVDDRIP